MYTVSMSPDKAWPDRIRPVPGKYALLYHFYPGNNGFYLPAHQQHESFLVYTGVKARIHQFYIKGGNTE